MRILTTIEKVFGLGRYTLVSRDDLQNRLTSKEVKDERDAESGEKQEVELHDANLKLGMMEDWKKWLRIRPEGYCCSPASFRGEGKLSRVAQKRNESEGRLRKVEAESCRRLIRLSTVFVK